MILRKFWARQLIASSEPSIVRSNGGAAILKRRLPLPLRAMHILRKWPFFLALFAVAVIGCGGGGSTPVASTTGTPPTRAAFGVNFPLNIAGSALIDTYLLPGVGRAPGDYEDADIGHIDYLDADGNNTSTENKLPPTITVNLNDFNAQNRRIMASVPAPEGGSLSQSQSRSYVELQLDVLKIRTPANPDPGMSPAQEPERIDNVFISGFPGRTTAVQIFLNSGMFPPDPTDPSLFDFDQAQ